MGGSSEAWSVSHDELLQITIISIVICPLAMYANSEQQVKQHCSCIRHLWALKSITVVDSEAAKLDSDYTLESSANF